MYLDKKHVLMYDISYKFNIYLRYVMNVGFSIIGQELDNVSNKPRRWNKFRPTIAFALQEDVPINKLVLAYQPGQEGLLEILQKDILSENKKLKIVPIPLQFKDPYDYDNCYSVLAKAVKEICKNNDDIYFHVNTGTHTMHFAMYIIAEKQVFPVKLVQTSKGKVKDKKIAYTTKSHARIIDLSWTHYPEIIDKVKEKDGFIYGVRFLNFTEKKLQRILEGKEPKVKKTEKPEAKVQKDP